jgi:RimJ/RimL family protein N-acetyltransferase
VLSDVRLRDVVETDLPILFEHQRDPEAVRMAAYPSRDREAFFAHWTTNILGNASVAKKTILCDGRIAGNNVSWEHSGRPLVGYWIGSEFWGRGVATRALSEFLKGVRRRPLYARVAKSNAASVRVLEKCGFRRSSEEPPGADGVEELVMELGPAAD